MPVDETKIGRTQLSHVLGCTQLSITTGGIYKRPNSNSFTKPTKRLYTKERKIFLLQLRGLLDGTDLVFAAVLLQHALIVVFPERLGRVLASKALQDLGAAGVLFEEV